MSETARRDPKLSKSRYLSGLQCELRLWRDCYDRELATEVSALTQSLFDAGHAVGELATTRHPGGVLIESDHLHHQESVEKTTELLRDRSLPALFEPGFIHEGVRIRVDIMARGEKNGWNVVEVKSTARPKSVHLDDLAVQCWVLNGCGIEVERAGILTLNRDYVYAEGEYDVDALFRLHDFTEEAKSKASEVGENVARLHEMLRRGAPPTPGVGDHCSAPYDCAYYGACTAGMDFPDHPISDLPRLHPKKRKELEEIGVDDLRDVPEGLSLTEAQDRVRACAIAGREHISTELRRALHEPELPLHYLDFETFMPPLPRYPGTRPFQALPFQWSNHIQRADGSLEHQEYLCREDKDPREELARALLESLASRGAICTYSGYELQVIRALADALPSLSKRLLALTERCWDLCRIIRSHYYHPDFHGSFSLKQVLPVLVPEMSYDGLGIQDGHAAARAYLELLDTSDREARVDLERALLEYCEQDTLAMVKMREALLARCG